VYLNIGLYFKNEDDNIKINTITIHDVHFFGRYHGILESKAGDFDLSVVEDISVLTGDIILNIENKIIPFLIELARPDYLKKIIRENNLPWDRIWLKNVTSEGLLKLIETN